MDTKHILRTLAIIAILSCNIGCDQVSKKVVRANINYHERISLLHNHLTLTKIENTGAFLSLGQSLKEPAKTILLTALPIIMLTLALAYLLIKTNLTISTITGFCFIIGGGVGNLYDRLVYGSVTDFMHIDFIFFQTGVFNVADVSIMSGTFLILIGSFLKKNNSNSSTGESQTSQE